MGDVTNLRQARKRKRRTERESEAAGNRVIHGRPADDRLMQKSIRVREESRLEGHRRVRSDEPKFDA